MDKKNGHIIGVETEDRSYIADIAKKLILAMAMTVASALAYVLTTIQAL